MLDPAKWRATCLGRRRRHTDSMPGMTGQSDTAGKQCRPRPRSVWLVLALCLARPVLTGMKKFQGNEKTSTVIVLDNSYSMQDGSAAQSNFARAREELLKTIKAMRRGSDAAVVNRASTPPEHRA